MGHLEFLIRDLALILVVAGITTLIFKKIKQPVVLGYILAGFLTGSNFKFLPNIDDLSTIAVWAELGIIFIMFGLGLEFSFHKLANVGGSAIVTAITIIIPMVFLGFLIGNLLGWSKMDSIFLGGMISMSSTMVIIKAYEELGLKPKSYSNIVLGTLIVEDIVGVFMMVILSAIAISKGVIGFQMVGDIGVLLMYLGLWLVLGIYLIPSFLRKTKSLMNDETLLIISLGLCLFMVVVANYIGFSSALGAFIAGSILAGTVLRERIEKLITPIKDLFGAVFFISVGVLLDFSTLAEYILPIIIISIVTVFGQMLFSTIGAILSGQTLNLAIGVGFSMVQIGEFSFIIAALGTALGVTSGFLYPVIVFVSVITIFTTPFFLKRIDWARVVIAKVLPTNLVEYLNRYTSDKQSVNEIDEDWHEYLTKYFTRISVSIIVLFSIYSIGTRWFEPKMSHFFSVYEEPVSTLLICLVMVPIISIMSSHKNVLYSKLWLKRTSNRLPLLAFTAFGIIIGSVFIVLTVNTILDVPVWVVEILAIITVILIIKSDFIRSKSIILESGFFKNFNERTFAKRQKEHQRDKSEWVDTNLFVAQFEVIDTPKKNSFKDFYSQRKLGVHILKILRNGEHINLPTKEEQIFAGDIIYVMGPKKQIESYLLMLEKDEHIKNPEESKITLRDFIYGQIF
ncbi:MAG: cation:proton antiporter, partial [Peptostreptococcaceae bacterium]|nr:cation:proton antiporter [Peptostreptococcaceae bacterium]